MKKFKMVHRYDVDVETWVYIVFNTAPEDEDNLLELENLQEREEIERFEDERYVKTRVRYFAVGFIPKQVRHILKPDMLSWIEEAVFDKQENFWTWNIVPHFFKKHIKCRGKMSVVPDGPGRCKRVTDGYLDIRIPVFSDFAERLIIDHLKINFDQEYEIFTQAMRRRVAHDPEVIKLLKKNEKKRERADGGRKEKD